MSKKKNKRGNGEGSVYYSEKMEKWIAQATVGTNPKTGRPKRKSFYGKTRKEAVDKMQKVLTEVREGTYSEPTNTTVESWLNQWLEGRKPHVAYNTYIAYYRVITCHINPQFGKMKLKDLKTRDIQTFINEKFENGRRDGKGGLSPRMVKYINQTLRKALNQAIKERLIKFNPTDGLELPKNRKPEMQTLSKEEIAKLLKAAEGTQNYNAYILALGTGMRRGEILGLKWQDIDFEEKTINVRRQLTNTENGTCHDLPLKTEKAKRTIFISDEVIAALERQRQRIKDNKKMLWSEYEDNNLVFCKDNGEPLVPRVFLEHFEKDLKQAGVKHIRFHDLRHTFATLSLERDVPLKTVSDILGHSTIAITGDIYSHVTDKMKMEASETMESILGESKKSDGKDKSSPKGAPHTF